MTVVSAIPGLDLHIEVGGTRPGRALEAALRVAIHDRRLVPGTRLPASRTLASDLGVSRATVSAVYGQLTAEGWLEARVGAGTWVAQGPRPAAQPPVPRRPARQLVELRGGRPDPSLFPRREWLAAARRAVSSATVAELGYADVSGVERLRSALAGYLGRTRGVLTDARLLTIGHGFGELLALVSRAIAARGGRLVAVEQYGHEGHREIIRAAGLELLPLPVDDDGADVELLDRADAAAVLLTASHQFPIGVPLSPARRRIVTAWAARTGGYVLEDDYDGEFRYDRRPVGTLQSLAPAQVVYLGTASKALAPAVGLAWAALPEPLLGPVAEQRPSSAEPRDALNQLTLAELIDSHDYDRQVRRLRGEYRRRRDELAAQLARRAPEAAMLGVAAGLQCSVELPAGTAPAVVVAAGRARGLRFRTLDSYAVPGSAPRRAAVVIGFGAPPVAQARSTIRAAVDAIASVAHARR